ncbi:MAG TPA: carboxypeptidase-like regulatory domain-containing protein, partial [Pyrinomonadaceae bacterium]|nr:carboxypeptidase-like regulatory domain-containing protein [Pyrinomonadaceae bacterium]
LTVASGSSLESKDLSAGMLTLRVHDPAKRQHQFLIALERANNETKVEPPLFAFEGAQRETGELLVEGIGAMELKATESGGLRRMDVREANAITRSLSHFPLQAAFRYNRRAGDAPKLQLEWRQFSDADVLSAVVERATVTTLANVEGRTLTEVTLRVRNHSQAFVKVGLPQGATLVSAEVEGKPVKPVEGSDGNRVPLLRQGLNPSGAYSVSFVYHHTGARFAKSGTYDMGLPRLDIPINLLTWEVALPERLQVKQFGGNAFSAEVFPAAAQNFLIDGADDDEVNTAMWTRNDLDSLEAGQIGGIIVDPVGAVVPGAQVTVNTPSGASLSTTSDPEGRWMLSGLESGPVSVNITVSGFKRMQQDFNYDNSRPLRMGTTLEVANITETVTVTGSVTELEKAGRRIEESLRTTQAQVTNAPSQNVFNLQRRVAGILPVRIEVPRSGRSYHFVRPLVLDEETRITFQYKSK